MPGAAMPALSHRSAGAILALACFVLLACRDEKTPLAEKLAAPTLTGSVAVPVSRCTDQTKYLVKDKTNPIAPEGEQLCWAASAEMAMNAIERYVPHKQCRQCNERFNPTNALDGDCCSEVLKPSWCDQPAGGIPPLWGWTSTPLPRALEVDEITDELCVQQRPFLIAEPANGGSGHMEIAITYDQDSTGPILVAYNPSNGVVSVATIPLDKYQANFTRTFYKIEKKTK